MALIDVSKLINLSSGNISDKLSGISNTASSIIGNASSALKLSKNKCIDLTGANMQLEKTLNSKAQKYVASLAKNTSQYDTMRASLEKCISENFDVYKSLKSDTEIFKKFDECLYFYSNGYKRNVSESSSNSSTLNSSSDIFSSVKSFIRDPFDNPLVTPEKRSSLLDLGKKLLKVDSALKSKFNVGSILPVVNITKGLMSSPKSKSLNDLFTSLRTQGKAVSFKTENLPVSNKEVFDTIRNDSLIEGEFGVCTYDKSADEITLTSFDKNNIYSNTFLEVAGTSNKTILKSTAGNASTSKLF